jgi:predicted RNase H-like nuclease (RuvC/YqgF family)
MDNEQLTSNLGELIKNQIDICEKLDKIGKQIKKIGKPKKPSNYDLNNIFGNPVEQLDKITCKQAEPKPEQTDIRKQANDLVDKFKPLVNGWEKMNRVDCSLAAVTDGSYWSYGQLNQRKAAIKCAIVHCELMKQQLIVDPEYHTYNNLKSELQKMLSE